MKARILVLVTVLALALALTGCAAPDTADDVPPVDNGAAGLRLAPGLYDQDDGTVMALGTLEYRDLEGGLWAITEDTVTDASANDIAAVINNADEFAGELAVLEGKSVSAIGTRFNGVSIRMAGPEIVLESIEEVTDTSGIAE